MTSPRLSAAWPVLAAALGVGAIALVGRLGAASSPAPTTPVSADAASAGVDSGAAGAIEVVDLLGRRVVLPGPAQRVLLGEGRDLVALSLLHPDPAALICAWLGDMRTFEPELYARYLARFPELDAVPTVGVSGEQTFSVEAALAAQPDLAILGLGGHGPGAHSDEVVRILEAAGVPVVFVDFRAHPLENTLPSMRLLGAVLGCEARAEAFAALYTARLARLDALLSQVAGDAPPRMFMEMHAGASPVHLSPGQGNLGEFIERAGGRNLGADVIPGPLGRLSLEYVIDQDPEVYVATGVPQRRDAAGLAAGAGITPAEAQASLAEVVSRSGIAELSAVKGGRCHGLWHSFYSSPLNVVALEALAGWLHPTLADRLDPQETLDAIEREFLPVRFDGAFWTTLER